MPIMTLCTQCQTISHDKYFEAIVLLHFSDVRIIPSIHSPGDAGNRQLSIVILCVIGIPSGPMTSYVGLPWYFQHVASTLGGTVLSDCTMYAIMNYG